MDRVLASRLLAGIAQHSMLRAGDRVGVAVSGGADSVALLRLLLEARERLGIVLSVAHFNHKLRGRSSDEDEGFVARLADQLGLTFHVGRGEVAVVAQRDKINLEDAARRARYAFFAKLAETGQLTHVAVAHTADDQAETVLAHIFRGTGLAGLGGIHPMAGHIVRPLLQVRRAELRSYLRAKKQTWREDATNRDTTRMRARIRKKLMPLLEKSFQPAVVGHLGKLAELARDDEALLENVSNERAAALFERGANVVRISIPELLRPVRNKSSNRARDPLCKEKETRNSNPEMHTPMLRSRGARSVPQPCGAGLKPGAPSALQGVPSRGKPGGVPNWCDGVHDGGMPGLSKRLVRRAVSEVKSRGGQLQAEHVEAVLRLAASGQNGTLLCLPGAVEVRRERDALVFCAAKAPRDAVGKKRRGIEYQCTVPSFAREALVPVTELGCAFRFRVIDWPAERGQTSAMGSVLDRDLLRFPLVLRNWQPGDRLQPLGHRSAHKLNRLLNEKRVGRWGRDGWPVLTSDGLVAWTRGLAVSAQFAANEMTRVGIMVVEEQEL